MGRGRRGGGGGGDRALAGFDTIDTFVFTFSTVS